jgi:flagellar biosynthesis protein FliQ
MYMDFLRADLFEQAWRTAVLGILPSLLIPVAGVVVLVVQGWLRIGEESSPYAVRMVVAVAVVAIFGSRLFEALQELMVLALR